MTEPVTIAKVNLTQGGFWVNLTMLNKVTNNIKPIFYPTTCEAYGGPSSTVQLFHGNGAYAGITGALSISDEFVFVVPRLKSGACNMSQNATPTHMELIAPATGHVSY